MPNPAAVQPEIDRPASGPNLVSSPAKRSVLSWMNKGTLAILDQGLISGSNFVLSILLARWLTPSLYGAYAVAFGVFVLLTLVYSALVLEPMSVFGGAAYRSSLRGYVKSLLKMHAVISLAFFAVVACGAAAIRFYSGDQPLAGAMLAVAVATPGILLLWVLRRALYLRMHAGQAASGAAVYCLLMGAGLWILKSIDLLTPFSALLLLGVAATLASLILLILLRRLLAADREPAPTAAQAWNKHWGYGRWALAGSFAAWLPAYIFFPLVTIFAGMAQAGELKALTNFIAPLDQTLAAFSLLFLPHAARVRAEQGSAEIRSLTRNLLALSIAGSAVYWLIVISSKSTVFSVLYSGKYSEVAFLLPAVALGSILWSAAYGPAIALRAMESPKSVFIAYTVTSMVCVAVGIPATRYFGLSGAVWSGNLADFASLVVILVIVYRKLRQKRQTEIGAVYPMSPSCAREPQL